MRFLTQKGSYNQVPLDFVIVFWASTDAAITHGEPSMCVDNYPPAVKFFRAKLKGETRKDNLLGTAIPYKCPKTGRKMVGIVDRHSTHEDPWIKNAEKALESLKTLMLKTLNSPNPMKRFSIHVNTLGISETERMIQKVFVDTDFDILLRYY